MHARAPSQLTGTLKYNRSIVNVTSNTCAFCKNDKLKISAVERGRRRLLIFSLLRSRTEMFAHFVLVFDELVPSSLITQWKIFRNRFYFLSIQTKTTKKNNPIWPLDDIMYSRFFNQH